MADQRKLRGVVVRGYLPHLKKLELIEPLLSQLSSAAARQLLLNPPGITQLVDAAPVEDLLEGVAALRGEDTVRKLALAMACDTVVPAIRPLVTSLLRLFGTNPASLFSHLPSLTLQLIHGSHFTYAPDGDTRGTIEVSHPWPCRRVWFLAWEGVFGLAFELCSVRGEVKPHVISADAKSAKIPVAWG